MDRTCGAQYRADSLHDRLLGGADDEEYHGGQACAPNRSWPQRVPKNARPKPLAANVGNGGVAGHLVQTSAASGSLAGIRDQEGPSELKS
jgi:hypothetical protein